MLCFGDYSSRYFCTMDKQFFNNIEYLIELENESVRINSEILINMMYRGIRDINQLDRVADKLLDTMHGLTGAGENMYHKYLDYIATFDPQEAKERRDDLEYEMGYKTHVLYAAALLCWKETEDRFSLDGRSSFQVIMDEYIPKVNNVLKKTASFLFFAHYANGKTVAELMPMLQAITEETDYVHEHVDELDDLMHYPSETYHPLTEKEWRIIQYIAEHNIELYEQNRDQNKAMMETVFG